MPDPENHGLDLHALANAPMSETWTALAPFRMPLHERAGPALGCALAVQNLPAILDLSLARGAQAARLLGRQAA